MRIAVLIIFLFFSFLLHAQYPPAAGQEGSTAVYKDSSIFINWAKRCYVQRGYYDIINLSDSIVSNGSTDDALGKADASTISIGDQGVAVLNFNPPISDDLGPDFAVFENSFDGQFLELAFVEVSSDSVHWYRFDAISLTQQNTQIPGFGNLDPTKIYNLAGKYQAMYGTPFDLSELVDKPYLNIDSISYVKIIDVIGTINPSYASYDSEGNMINDPYPTPFLTGGFDLDAVGVIHERALSVNNISINSNIKIFPNPCHNTLYINNCFYKHVVFFDMYGNKVLETECYKDSKIDVSQLKPGLYSLKFVDGISNTIKKLVVQ